MLRSPFRFAVICSILAALGCGGGEPIEVDAQSDVDAHSDIDAAREVDAAPEVDAALDAGTDAAEVDASLDTGTDGGPCASCDDGIACTIDSCDGTTCTHLVSHGACATALYCDPAVGCRTGGACASAADCTRPDTCVTVTCNAAAARCEYRVLDGDSDGHAPAICGGDDCDDANAERHGGADETCDLVDQDCDAAIDEDNAETTACGDLSTCTDSFCRCPPELDWCVVSGSPFATFACVDVQTDERSCGGCGITCPTGVDCVDGACACPAGASYCYPGCVALETDANNCGRCGNVCPAGIACVAGVCACPAGTSSCNGVCADLATDERHCGTCGNYCPDGVTCTDGACPCPGGGVTCNGDTRTCTDLSGTSGYCGACNRVCQGTCVDDVCTCEPGLDRCETTYYDGSTAVVCTDLATDVANCGECGHFCPGNQACMDGICQGCVPPYTECDGREGPHCVDTRTDAEHCGRCGNRCFRGWCAGGFC